MRRHYAKFILPGQSNEPDGSKLPGDESDVGTAMVSLEPLRGDEKEAFDQQRGLVTHRIRAVWPTKFNPRTPRLRIEIGNRKFNVKSVINVGEINRELEVLATEVV